MNLNRLKNCMLRAGNGESLTIGFFGGSITQGSLSSSPENCYAYKVFEWWQETFPQAEFSYVNGGIGGTTSHFGVSRVVTDLLMYQPDVVFIDFSVNDEPDEFFEETYEGLLRKILNWPSQPAVILLNNVYYDTGVNAQEYHNRIGNYYHVPHVSIKDTIYVRMKNGEYKREELSPDGLHPDDRGHALVAKELTDFLKLVKESKTEPITEPPDEQEVSTLSKPLTANAYEHAKRLTIKEVSPNLSGFRADAREKNGHLDFFKNGWIGKKTGDRITFEVTASNIAVQYRKTIRRPARRAKLILDGDAANARILDGNFNENWGDCLFLEPVLHHGECKKHTLELEIMSEDDGTESNSATPFYLLSLIIA